MVDKWLYGFHEDGSETVRVVQDYDEGLYNAKYGHFCIELLKKGHVKHTHIHRTYDSFADPQQFHIFCPYPNTRVDLAVLLHELGHATRCDRRLQICAVSQDMQRELTGRWRCAIHPLARILEELAAWDYALNTLDEYGKFPMGRTIQKCLRRSLGSYRRNLTTYRLSYSQYLKVLPEIYQKGRESHPELNKAVQELF